MDSNLDPKKILVDSVDQHQPLGRFLILLFRAFEDDLSPPARGRGLLGCISRRFERVEVRKARRQHTSIEIAKLAGVTKQAIAKSIAAIEAKGYIKRQPNSEDGRSQIIVFTPKGMRLLKTCIAAISQIESIYEAKWARRLLLISSWQ